jgi:hypothetical protein
LPPPELKAGDRIRLLKMPFDPCPVADGTLGTVVRVVRSYGPPWQVWMEWDDGCKLAMCVPPDEFEKIDKEAQR